MWQHHYSTVFRPVPGTLMPTFETLLKSFPLLGMLLEISSTVLPLHVCVSSLKFLSLHENSPNNTNEMSRKLIKNNQTKQQQKQDGQEDSQSSYCWAIGGFFSNAFFTHPSFPISIKPFTFKMVLSTLSVCGSLFWLCTRITCRAFKTLDTQIAP